MTGLTSRDGKSWEAIPYKTTNRPGAVNSGGGGLVDLKKLSRLDSNQEAAAYQAEVLPFWYRFSAPYRP